MLRDLGVDLPLEIYTDSKSAQGIANRRGLNSRTRHVAVHFLWIQERIAKGDFKLSKVWGNINPADLMTKHLSRDNIAQHMKTLGIIELEGRPEAAPSLVNQISYLFPADALVSAAFPMPLRRW